jgi:hypothetical protein
MADKQETLARIRARQMLKNSRAGEKGELLDDADLNIGNAIIADPYPSSDPLTPPVIIPISNPPRIINLDALSRTGKVVTIALTAQTVLRPNISQQSPTPITGIVEFGNGGQFTRIEVDIPVGRVFAIGANFTLQEPEDGVVYVTVPAGTLRVFARNDSKFITPTNNGFIGSDAPPFGLPPVDGDADSALVKAFVVYYPIRGSRSAPTKTNYIGRTSGATVIVYINDPSSAYLVPPLAKRFRLLRTIPGFTMPAFTGSIYDAAGNTMENFSVALNVMSPWFELPGIAHRIGLEFTITGSNGFAAIVFEIGA